jgi:CheY-like chemotaxis protein
MKTHILVIDDDIDEMKTFVEAMKQVPVPFKCTYAANGIRALKMLFYLRPGIIFVDYEMPAMNGIEFIQELRTINELNHIPIFLYARRLDRHVKSRAHAIGVAGCLEKPGDMAGFVGELKKVLSLSN